MIKAADKTIHSLSQRSSRFLKTIRIIDDNTEACFCYFRDFSIDYRMKDHPKDENEFEVYLKGVDEKLFPSDVLDEAILTAITKFYKATVRTSLFIFSADLSGLQGMYNRHKCSSVHIRFLLNANANGMVNVNLPTIELQGYSLRDFKKQFVEEKWFDAEIKELDYRMLCDSIHEIKSVLL